MKKLKKRVEEGLKPNCSVSHLDVETMWCGLKRIAAEFNGADIDNLDKYDAKICNTLEQMGFLSIIADDMYPEYSAES